jgi:putative ABC transport system permease protein
VVSLLVGILVTLVASLRPALRATRVPPIAAVREGSVLPPSRLARFGPVAALLVGGLGIAGLCVGAFDGGLSGTQRLLLVGVGVLLLFLGVSIIAPKLVKPITTLIGPFATWSVAVLTAIVFPLTLVVWFVRTRLLHRDALFPSIRPDRDVNQLATRNALRMPTRTASTAAALMIGLALVTFVAVLATGLKSTFENAVRQEFHGDYALTSQNGFSPSDISSENAVRKVPQVSEVLGVRAGLGKAFGKQIGVTAITPGATIGPRTSNSPSLVVSISTPGSGRPVEICEHVSVRP